MHKPRFDSAFYRLLSMMISIVIVTQVSAGLLLFKLYSTAPFKPPPGMSAPLQWGAEIVVTTRDGERYASRLDDFERLGPGARPMTRDALWEKFADCAQRALPRRQIAPLFEHLLRIGTVPNIAELTPLLEVRAAQAA